MKTRLMLRGGVVAALLTFAAAAGPVGLTRLPRAFASCGGWQYISSAQTNGINIYLIRDACNNTFGYSDNAPAGSTVCILSTKQSTLCSGAGSGPLQSPSDTVQCGAQYNATVQTLHYGFGEAPTGSGHQYC